MTDKKSWFENQSQIAAILAHTIEKNNVKKASICKEAGISRPTLDKLLTGNFTNKAFYDENMPKILKAAGVSIDDINDIKGGSSKNLLAVLRSFALNENQFSKITNIPVETVQSWCEGEEIPEEAVYDICAVLGISKRMLEGKFSFYSSKSFVPGYMFLNEDNIEPAISGHWGDVGILMKGTEKYKWNGITHEVRISIIETLHNDELDAIIVPTLEGTVLYVRKSDILDLILLDDACDSPHNADWDYEKRLQPSPVIQEVMEDYLTGMGTISPTLEKIVCDFLEKQNLNDTDSAIYELCSKVVVTFVSGFEKTYYITEGAGTNIADIIITICQMDEQPFEEYLWFERIDEGYSYLRLENISKMEISIPVLEHRLEEDIEEDD